MVGSYILTKFYPQTLSKIKWKYSLYNVKNIFPSDGYTIMYSMNPRVSVVCVCACVYLASKIAHGVSLS